MPWKSTTTAGSVPMTQASCPDGRSDTSPGPQSNSWPSSMRTRSTPDTWYWKCGASQLEVPASGCTDVCHRHPGSKTARPMVTPPTATSSRRPSGNSRISSGVVNALTCACRFMSRASMSVEPETHPDVEQVRRVDAERRLHHVAAGVAQPSRPTDHGAQHFGATLRPFGHDHVAGVEREDLRAGHVREAPASDVADV